MIAVDRMEIGSLPEAIRQRNIFWRNAMLKVVCSHWRKRWFFLILPLVLLCGCSSLGNAPAAPAATVVVNQASLAATAAAKQAPLMATAAAQTVLATYAGKWDAHDVELTINANGTGLEVWNAGPCDNTMCGGNASLTFIVNTDGSLTGTIHSVSYSQNNGTSAPSGFQPDPGDPKAGDVIQIQRSGAHLLFSKGNSLNSNRYWCGNGASQADHGKCGA
jgi:hypothetical protein